jgi:hypothetical protein
VIEAMPRPRPPYLSREVTRHGKPVWYVRIGKGPRIRIKYDFGTPEFMAAYQAIVAGQPFERSPAGPPVKFSAKTLGWAIEQYRQSANAKGTWANLSPATRAQREPFLCEACDKHGHATLAQITRASIEKAWPSASQIRLSISSMPCAVCFSGWSLRSFVPMIRPQA